MIHICHSLASFNPGGKCPAGPDDFLVTSLVQRNIEFSQSAGVLSVKGVFRGTEQYETPNGRYPLGPENFLVLNRGQKYSSHIRDELTESLCLFFPASSASDVESVARGEESALLDRGGASVSEYPPLFEQLYRHDHLISPLLFAIRNRMKNGIPDELWLHEQLMLLLSRLVAVNRSLWQSVLALPYSRPSTRIERYQRVQRAREFIDAEYHRDLSLDEIAGVACLSPFHFLRSFRDVVGVTPFQYITGRRMEAARDLLLTTDLPITCICFDVGFQSPGSFSSLFRRSTGMAPSQFRAMGES